MHHQERIRGREEAIHTNVNFDSLILLSCAGEMSRTTTAVQPRKCTTTNMWYVFNECPLCYLWTCSPTLLAVKSTPNALT